MVIIVPVVAQALDLIGYLWATSNGQIESNPIWSGVDPIFVAIAKTIGIVLVAVILLRLRRPALRYLGSGIATAAGLVGFVSAILVMT